MSTKLELCLTLSKLPFHLEKLHLMRMMLIKLPRNLREAVLLNLKSSEVEEEWDTLEKLDLKVESK